MSLSRSSSCVDRSISCGVPCGIPSGIRNLYPILTKHPRCRPFFRLGDYGVICARAGAHAQDRTIRFYDRDDVEGLGLDPTRVHLRARENLRALFDSGELPIRSVRTAGRACLVVEHAGLATSCLFLPQLREKAHGIFGFQKVIAAIVRRNLLVVFADPGMRSREDMARGIGRALLKNASSDSFLADESSALVDLFALEGSNRVLSAHVSKSIGKSIGKCIGKCLSGHDRRCTSRAVREHSSFHDQR